GLVFAVFEPSLRSEAVSVLLPELLKVTLKVLVPDVRGALAGSVALLSEDVIPTLSVMVLIWFQFASTALTVTLKAMAAVCVDGLPVFPVALPGDAASPGTSSCSFTNTPALTVIAGLVLAVMPACVMAEA